jgi:hypothetical protein
MMRLLNISIVVVLSLSLLASAYADLNNTTYVNAKEEYSKGDYAKALALLKKYKSEDDKFLENNPDVLSAINDAIRYCEKSLSGIIGMGFSSPHKPDLPNQVTR